MFARLLVEFSTIRKQIYTKVGNDGNRCGTIFYFSKKGPLSMCIKKAKCRVYIWLFCKY